MRFRGVDAQNSGEVVETCRDLRAHSAGASPPRGLARSGQPGRGSRQDLAAELEATRPEALLRKKLALSDESAARSGVSVLSVL